MISQILLQLGILVLNFRGRKVSVLKPAEILKRFLEEPPIKESLTWLKETLQEAEKLAAPSWRK
jgi:hypothetical protein